MLLAISHMQIKGVQENIGTCFVIKYIYIYIYIFEIRNKIRLELKVFMFYVWKK